MSTPETLAMDLCDPDGVVRRGAMHHGTDYQCTGHAHWAGYHIRCTTPIHDQHVSIGDRRDGYPCPKDGAVLTLLDGGAWCPECRTVWREVGEVPLSDLDALPETDGPR